MADRKRKPGTTLYLLRDIDTDLWRRARSKALLEGRTIREVILDLLAQWAPTGGFVERPKRKRRRVS
jgi:hypothetical protein